MYLLVVISLQWLELSKGSRCPRCRLAPRLQWKQVRILPSHRCISKHALKTVFKVDWMWSLLCLSEVLSPNLSPKIYWGRCDSVRDRIWSISHPSQWINPWLFLAYLIRPLQGQVEITHIYQVSGRWWGSCKCKLVSLGFPSDDTRLFYLKLLLGVFLKRSPINIPLPCLSSEQLEK